jgi:hypothetical protein
VCSLCREHWERESDDLRCDLKSCRKLNIYSPQYDGVHMIASASNDVLQLRSDGKFLQKAPS